MREINTHKVNGCNEAIQVTALDKPSHGGACHEYRACVPVINPVESHIAENSRRLRSYCDINFQCGPIAEAGVNGITHEALLAVLIDRLEGFQSGSYACADNQEALDALRTAMTALQRRTKARVARGVEGTHKI
jgi:hypothetical protein